MNEMIIMLLVKEIISSLACNGMKFFLHMFKGTRPNINYKELCSDGVLFGNEFFFLGANYELY